MSTRSTLVAATTTLALLSGGLTGCDTPEQDASPPASTCEKYESSLQETLDDTVSSLGIPGATVAVEAPGCSWAGASGQADLEAQTPMKGTDLLRIGSVTKTFTAALVMMLVEDGELSLDDAVAAFVPELPNGENITIRQLLNHTSGLPNYVEDPDFYAKLAADPYKVWSPQEVVDQAMQVAPYFEPGADWHYSNTGYILLGMVIEKVTGAPYEAALDSRILGPLELEHTYLDPGDGTKPKVDGLIHGYAPSEDGGMVDVTTLYSTSAAWSAGALVSTVEDVNRFYRGLFEGGLLAPAQLAEMRTYPPVTTDFFQAIAPGCVGYGFGLVQCDRPHLGRLEGHSGSIWGYSSIAFHVPERDLYMSIVLNADDLTAVEEVMLAMGGVVADE